MQQQSRFLTSFCAFFRSEGGTPGTSRDSPGPPEAPESILSRFWDVPGRAFGRLWAPQTRFVPPLASHLHPWAPLGRPKWAYKYEKDRSWGTLRSRSEFGGRNGQARTLIMWFKHHKYGCSRKRALSPRLHQKVSVRVPKSEPLASFLVPFGGLGPTLGVSWRQSGHTVAPP